ncbi:MAG: hypothetical protein PHX13_12240, partial [Thiovulaceae bacterium]|nr:hypothetical protein [Sulfurimonadaceae bacterium]
MSFVSDVFARSGYNYARGGTQLTQSQYEKLSGSTVSKNDPLQNEVLASKSAGVSKTTFGVDSKAYTKPTISPATVLQTALGFTGVGAVTSAVAEFATPMLLEPYYATYPWLRPEYQKQYGVTGEAAKTLWAKQNNTTPAEIDKPAPKVDVTNPRDANPTNLITVLLSSVGQLSRLADVQTASYLQQVEHAKQANNALTGDQLKAMLDEYKSGVDNAITTQLSAFGTQYTDMLKATDDKLLENNSYIDDLNANFKDAIDKSYQNSLDAMLKLSQSTDHQSAVLTDVAKTLDSFAFDGLVVKKDEKDLALQDARLEHHEYQKTVVDVKDMDGNVVAN